MTFLSLQKTTDGFTVTGLLFTMDGDFVFSTCLQYQLKNKEPFNKTFVNGKENEAQ